MLTALTAALVYGLTGGLAPGPLMTFVIAQTLRHGAREGMKSAVVPLFSDFPIIALLLLLLDDLARVRPLVAAIALGGVVYLFYLAWESWRAKPPSASDPASSAPPRSIARGALVNLLNPNVYLFWLTAGTPLLLKAWHHSMLAAAGVLAVFFTSLIGCKLLLALLIARSRERVIGRWYVPAMRTLAVLLVAFAAVMARDALALL